MINKLLYFFILHYAAGTTIQLKCYAIN